MEKNFKTEIGEMQGRHDRNMLQKENQMDTLDSNLEILNNFKDTKKSREEILAREAKRYENLKRELETLKRNGKIQMEAARKKLADE